MKIIPPWKHQVHMSSKRFDWTPALLLYGIAVMYAFLHILLHTDLFGSSYYNTYTLQALAWRKGALSLEINYPHLELAFFKDNWYVSFPPVPSIPLFFLSYIFGSNTPDSFLVKLYIVLSCEILYFALRHSGFDRISSAIWSLFLCFASCMLPLTLNGAVWYQAQTLSFLLTVSAVVCIIRDAPTPALLFYALSVGCRPFNALYGFLLYFHYFIQCKKKKIPVTSAIIQLIPGTILGLLISFAYGLYNYTRFGDLFEFGHNYLPEFSSQGGIQFSLFNIPANASTFLFGSPFSYTEKGVELSKFGFSCFLANPIFICGVVWVLNDISHRKFSKEKLLICITTATHMFFLLLHRTFGGYQFGARYTLDLVPYVVFYMLISDSKKRVNVFEFTLFLMAIAFNLYGTIEVGIT